MLLLREWLVFAPARPGTALRTAGLCAFFMAVRTPIVHFHFAWPVRDDARSTVCVAYEQTRRGSQGVGVKGG